MTDILFISETDLIPELVLAKQEISSQQLRMTNPINFAKAIQSLKSNFFEVILINGYNKKLDTYELCREIKNIFRNTVRIFVFLPEVNANEASRFGLLNAEVEDKVSIINLASKLLSRNSKEKPEIEENVTAIYSPYGGIGTSSIAISMAYSLNRFEQSSILIETNTNQSIKNTFDLHDSLPLLARDNSKDSNLDQDWFSGFISKTPFMPNLFYLNLFNSLTEKINYFDKDLVQLQDLHLEAGKLLNYEELSNKERTLKLNLIYNSLKLLSKELEGSSYSLFNEIIQTGTKLSHNFIFDLGTDIFSPLNKQLLKYTKSVVLVLKDSAHLAQNYHEHKTYLGTKGIQSIIPVIAANEFNYQRLSKIPEDNWLELLGEVPVIYPYALEEITNLVYEHRDLNENSKLLEFSKALLTKANIRTKELVLNSNRGILRFLMNNHA